MSTQRLILFLAVFAFAMPAYAGMRQWELHDDLLAMRTTSALERYYSMVTPDTARVRYVRMHGSETPYRVRALTTENDTPGRIVSLSLGQLTIGSEDVLRVALGDDLYRSLLLSRTEPTAEDEAHSTMPMDDHVDWNPGGHGSVALDGISWTFAPRTAAFARVGAPESNLYGWTDASARVGLRTPTWEFAILVPFEAGADAVGPFASRLLAPGYGAAAAARLQHVDARIRITGLGSIALEDPLPSDETYVHTLSSSIAWRDQVDTPLGPLDVSLGAGYEEFTAVVADSAGDAAANGRVRRLSPLADIGLTTAAGTVRYEVGLTDLALRAGVVAQLTGYLAIDVRFVLNDLFRDVQPFEHPSQIFLTPRFTF